MKRWIETALAAVLCCSCSGWDNLLFVDPMIGTCGQGTQYGGMMPMAGVPFGSAQWVPMTRLTEVSVLSYNETDSLLLGFIGTRQPAIWMGDWGQVSIQPQTGEKPVLEYSNRGQPIENQEYTPYCAHVRAGGVDARFAAMEHSAVFEFSAARHLVIDASRMARKKVSDPDPHPGHLEFSSDGMSAWGWNSDLFDGHHSSPKPGFKGYFYMEFSRRFTSGEVLGDGEDETQGFVSFASPGKPLSVKIGLSLISADQARVNLHREIGRAGVTATARKARKLWQEKFSVLTIEAPDDVKTIFYTGLYHCLLYPRQIDESGCYYSAFDDRIHEGQMYNCYSLWDTYRAEHPLLTLVAPERVDGMMQALIDMYKEGGWLPKWPNPSYTGIMVGSPAETVLAEAWTKGFRGFDIRDAYAAAKKNATVPQKGDLERDWRDRGCFGDTPETRAGLTRYQTIGYVAADETRESVSRTLDFGLQDLATAVLAEAVGQDEDAAYFRARSNNYRNLWNPDSLKFLPRAADGRWMSPTQSDYTECSPEASVWCVPYDVEGVCDLMGGREVFENNLDQYFDTRFWLPERGGRSIHGNEPSHHISYLYNRIGKHEKTGAHVREIMSRSYSTDRKGFDGNEDCGQMSAWYILSALGLYMLNPADGIYELGDPVVKKAVLKIGRPYTPATLKILSVGNPNAPVSHVTFNEKRLNQWQIHHNDLIRGGELVFHRTMSGSRPPTVRKM